MKLRFTQPFYFFVCIAVCQFASADEEIDFNRDVRPVLSDKCLTCHGADPKHVEAGLRLDLSESAYAKLESGKQAIVPGHPDDSELIRRIRLPANDDLRMPPVRSHKNMSPAETDILERWIAQGAEYKKHWAFVTPVQPIVPPVQQWGVNDIDVLVLAKLNVQGLSPSPEATRETLIRRASLDLTGLPPSVAEVDAFVKNTASTNAAYEKVIDRLLVSPGFAERMTMWWLDGARYADSNGFQSDDQRFMHGWRDWVLNAFEKNMPFDQFTIEQLAGDLLPDATLDQKIATGFNRNNRQNSEGGLIAEEWRIEGVIDRVEATSAVWMALTIGCARCHDHKYDPISQKEMYQFFSYFNNVPESGVASAGNTAPLLQTPGPSDGSKIKDLDAAIASAQQLVQNAESMMIPAAEAWATNIGPKLQQSPKRWRVLDGELSSRGGSKLKAQADGSIQVSGDTPATDAYTLSHQATQPKKITAIQLEAIPHATLAANGFGRKGNGNIVLGEFEAEMITASFPDTIVPIKIAKAFADYSQANWNISAAIDGNPATGWALDGLDPSKQVTRHAVFVLSEPVALDAGSRLTIRLKQESLGNHNFGLFRLSATEESEISEAILSPLPEPLVAAILVLVGSRSDEQKKSIVDYYRTLSESPVAKATSVLDTAKKAKADFERNLPTVMVMQETPQPRDCFVLVRGQYDKPGEKVTASLPAALPHMAAKAKRVIYLFQSGAPSQMELFDYKPTLEKLRGENLPDSIRNGQRLTGMSSGQANFPIAPSIFKFSKKGKCGADWSELMPFTGELVDELAIVRSMNTEAINHDPAITFFQTGNQLPGRPSIGSWLAYGLGSENQDLPAYVVLTSKGTGRTDDQPLYDRLWGSGFLPTQYQGVKFRNAGDPVLYLSNPPGVDRDLRRAMLDEVRDLNEQKLSQSGDPEITTRIAQYEMAFRMQTSVPELANVKSEPQHILDLYGPEVNMPGKYAANCLLARRLAERGVRFIQLFHMGWDHHGNLPNALKGQCKDTDQPTAALIQDLKQHGLLDDTLIFWGGEFGRTVYTQGALTESYGRDHHPRCFSLFLTGGGIKPGITHGETDDYCYNIVKDGVHVRDLHATILHQLGIDHERFTYPFNGLDAKLTGVEPARVVTEILA